MRSQKPNSPPKLFQLKPFPGSVSVLRRFWSTPVEAGFYGKDWHSDILLVTNHQPTLAKLASIIKNDNLSITVLAIEAGGLSVQAAGAFDSLAFEIINPWLNVYPSPKDPHRILVPQSMREFLNQKENQFPTHWQTSIVPDDFLHLKEWLSETENKSDINTFSGITKVTQRIKVGINLWIGQVLLFSLPLILFSVRSLIAGLLSLLIGMLVLTSLWQVLPRPFWLKGFISGSLLAIIGGLVMMFIMSGDTAFTVSGMLAILISTLWMSLVLMGAKPA